MKKNNKEKKQFKKVRTATVLTVALATTNLSTLAYAGELEVEENMINISIESNNIKEELFTEEREEREENEEEINNEDVVINKDSELINNQIETQSSVNTFDLSSWTYKEYSTSIILDKYNGTDINIVIPGEINGKQVKIGTMNCFEDIKSTINSLVFREKNGKKVQAPSTIGNYIFKGYASLENVDFSGLDTSTTNNMSNISGMFVDCTSLVNVNLSGFITSKVNDISYMFTNCNSLKNVNLTGVDTSNVTSMRYMFEGCKSLEKIELDNFNTENVTDMDNMFRNCSSLRSLDLSSFDTSKVTSMINLFIGCNSLENITFSNKFNTSSVVKMNNMFKDCNSLKNLDLSSFDTSSVINMSYMFSNSGVSNLDLSSFDTSSVTNMQGMFYNTGELKNITFGEKFNTSLVENMSYMFCSTSLESLDLSKFDTSSLTNTSYMFAKLDNIKILDLSKFNLENVQESKMNNMFKKNIIADSEGNITEVDLDSSKKELLVITKDNKLVNYDYISDACLPVGPTLDANGGEFLNGDKISYKFKIHTIDAFDKITIDEITNRALSSEKPTKDGYIFVSWEPQLPTMDENNLWDRLNTTYYANWDIISIEKPEGDVAVPEEDVIIVTDEDKTTQSGETNSTVQSSGNNSLPQTGDLSSLGCLALGLASTISGVFINRKKKN